MNEVQIRRIFFALAVLYVLPFWTVRYLPMMDGACHTYNAWVLRQHGNVEQYPLFNQYYEINARPYPNWISQGNLCSPSSAGKSCINSAVPPRVSNVSNDGSSARSTGRSASENTAYGTPVSTGYARPAATVNPR